MRVIKRTRAEKAGLEHLYKPSDNVVYVNAVFFYFCLTTIIP
jgi:hypothetical protein